MVRQRMTGRERREQLISIGRAAFAELGFEGTSVEEIASRAGVSKPVVYEHFGGKEGLYAVVVDREMLALEEVIKDSLEEGSWRERIELSTRPFSSISNRKRWPALRLPMPECHKKASTAFLNW